MTRYFFNLSAENGDVTDLIGVDLPGVEAARLYAKSRVTELWSEQILAGKPPLIGWLEVVDSENRAVLRVPL